MKRAVGTLLVAMTALAAAASAQAATLQSIGTFSEPTYVTSDPGNPNRLFVVQRAGRIMQVENGAVSEFANLESVVSSPLAEGQGLSTIALAPDFDTSGRFFVDYTDRSPFPSIHVAEMQASGQTAALSSLHNLLTIEHPRQTNDYGGQLQLGPEGLLYVSTGDGGGSYDQEHDAQSLTSLLGKILRIQPGPAFGTASTVPPGNPFPASPIFAYGLRNPYRFSFDRLTHDLVIGDIGQETTEEVDWGPAPGLGVGADYGWSCFEGRHEVPPEKQDPQCATPPSGGFVAPSFEYPHISGAGVVGGYVARDPSLPELYGRYVYGDLGSGEIRSLVLSEGSRSDRSEGLGVSGLDSFGEDSCGRLYAVSLRGPVYRLVGPNPSTCTPAPPAAKPLAPSTVGIRAVTRRVRHDGRAQITVWVSPCTGRRGEPVRLLRGKVRLGSRRLDRACTARFLPRVTHRVKFRAEVRADSTYAAAVSRQLPIHICHAKRCAKPRGDGTRLHIPAGVGRR